MAGLNPPNRRRLVPAKFVLDGLVEIDEAPVRHPAGTREAPDHAAGPRQADREPLVLVEILEPDPKGREVGHRRLWSRHPYWETSSIRGRTTAGLVSPHSLGRDSWPLLVPSPLVDPPFSAWHWGHGTPGLPLLERGQRSRDNR